MGKENLVLSHSIHNFLPILKHCVLITNYKRDILWVGCLFEGLNHFNFTKKYTHIIITKFSLPTLFLGIQREANFILYYSIVLDVT